MFRFCVFLPELFKRADFLVENKLVRCDVIRKRDHSDAVDEMVAEFFEKLGKPKLEIINVKRRPSPRVVFTLRQDG